MIELMRQNGNPLVINSDLIKLVEAVPETMLTLINGNKIMVSESCAEVMERVNAYRSQLISEGLRRSPNMQDAVQSVAVAGADAALPSMVNEPAPTPQILIRTRRWPSIADGQQKMGNSKGLLNGEHRNQRLELS